MQTAAALQGYTDIFRAGIWKPRTSPDTFQGIGDIGLEWLQEVKDVTGMSVATEVSTPEQVCKALEAGIDYLWIGARSSANPILVQQLADAIAASPVQPKGVMVKNPVNEDAELWIGNVKRLTVFAVHRGCEHRPCWGMAHRLREVLPEIPLLLDPSHMSGKSEQVGSLCFTAQALGYEGLMTEVHVRPSEALSDARQQITPQEWREIRLQTEDIAVTDDVELMWLRHELDEIDERLWAAMSERMDVSRKIGKHKREKGLPVVQPERYQYILSRRLEWAKMHHLDPKAVSEMMHLIHSESIRVQS